jgi:O-antigen ligase
MRSLPGIKLAYFSLAFVGLLWTLPFLQPRHYFPLPMFESEWLAFALGLIALILLATKRAWLDGLPALALAPLGLAGLVLVQAALGRVPYAAQAFTATLYLVWAALLIALGAALRRELGMSRVVSTLAWCVVIGGEMSAVAGLLQYYDMSTILDPLIMPRVTGQIYGNLAQPNHFANYTALALFSLIYLFAVGRLRETGAILLTAPLLFVLGLSGSRSAWLYLAAAFVLAALMRAGRSDAQGRRLFVSAGLLLVGFYLAQWMSALAWLAPDAGSAVTATDRLLSPVGIGERLQMWREAWWMFLQAPVFGLGWGQFAWHDFLLKAQDGAQVLPAVATNAHNLLLQLLAETGLAGALLIAGGALLWLRDLRHGGLEAERWWVLALLATLCIHSLLEFPLWHAYFLGVAAIALGLGATRCYVPGLRRMGPVVAAVLLVAGVFNAVTVWYGYRDFARMFDQGVSLPGREIAAIVARGQRDPVLEPYVELAASAYARVDRDQLRDKLELNGRVMRFMPTAIVVYRQAMLLALDGQAQAAQALFTRAMRVYPDMLPRITTMVRELMRRNPLEFAPLLELATAKSTRQRALKAIKQGA